MLAQTENGGLAIGGEPWNSIPVIYPGSSTARILTGGDHSSPAAYYPGTGLTPAYPIRIEGGVILCLNGHTIRAAANEQAIQPDCDAEQSVSFAPHSAAARAPDRPPTA